MQNAFRLGVLEVFLAVFLVEVVVDFLRVSPQLAWTAALKGGDR